MHHLTLTLTLYRRDNVRQEFYEKQDDEARCFSCIASRKLMMSTTYYVNYCQEVFFPHAVSS